jgi:uncharacterized phage protein (TIGR02218 family)
MFRTIPSAPACFIRCFPAITVRRAPQKPDFDQHFCRAAGTLSGLFIFLATAIGGVLTGTVKSRKNAADGNQLISVTSAATGILQDASHTDSLAAADLYDASCVGTGSGGSGRTFGAWFSGTISAFELWAGSAATGNFGGTTTAAPFNMGGPFDGTTPETNRQLKVWRAFTTSNLRFWLRTASWGSATSATMRVRKNAGNGNQIISLTTSNTVGWLEDASHTDSLSANDLVNTNWIVGAPGATQIIFSRIGLNFDDGSNTGATTGTIAQTFTGFSQAAAGGLGDTATIAQTFSGFSQAATGAMLPVGTITQTFSGFTQVAHGEGSPGAPRSTQIVRLVPAEGTSKGRASQLARFAIAGVSSKGRATQVPRLTVATVQALCRTSQLARLTIADAVACGTTWCQCWRITRRDGVIFRFTSLDEDFLWGAESFSACASLNPSASESATALGQVGNIELTGIIAHDQISAGDLYGGLFDDAFVECWLVDYAGADTPKRIAAGWTGDLSQEAEGSFKMEVIGPGARLGQQALTQAVAPRCRWVFGDARCGVDREARALTGCTVMFAINRGDFTADINPGTLSSGGLVSGALSSGADENASQWVNGVVRFTTGQNAGQECEVKSVDFETGQIVLWALPAYTPETGDGFTLLPGCGQAADDCKFYDNFDRFGGFDDVPGDDSLAQVPDAKL